MRRFWPELAGFQEGDAVDPNDLVTGAEARERLKLSRAAFRRWCERHGVASYRLGVARAVRFRWSEIERAVEACRDGGPADRDGATRAGG